MSRIGQSERATQNRVIALFRDELGYRYLDDWQDREGNSNVEESLLAACLTRSGYDSAQISKAIHTLRAEADNHSRGLYGNNRAVYNLLRYGVPVRIEAGRVTETVHLIKKVKDAIRVYTSELDHSAGGADPEVMMQNRLSKGRERLK